MARDRCQLARLDAVHYRRILKTHHEVESTARQRLMARYPLFQDWAVAAIGTVSRYLQREVYRRGEAVLRECRHNDKVYIITQGLVGLVQHIALANMAVGSKKKRASLGTERQQKSAAAVLDSWIASEGTADKKQTAAGKGAGADAAGAASEDGGGGGRGRQLRGRRGGRLRRNLGSPVEVLRLGPGHHFSNVHQMQVCVPPQTRLDLGLPPRTGGRDSAGTARHRRPVEVWM